MGSSHERQRLVIEPIESIDSKSRECFSTFHVVFCEMSFSIAFQLRKERLIVVHIIKFVPVLASEYQRTDVFRKFLTLLSRV